MRNMLNYLILSTIFLVVNSSPNGEEYMRSLSENDARSFKQIDPSIVEDVYSDVKGLINKNGYPFEELKITTEDGYILTTHRIHLKKNIKNYPVLLMHGVLGSSADWILSGRNKALAYILADSGYDVWMGNARGNFYSRNHINLDPNIDKEFWDFSWDEIGRYDLPAIINHILKTTKQKKLHYIGYSQGGNTFFVMASERPEFNEKIQFMQGLAPAVFVSNAKNPVLEKLSFYSKSIGNLLKILGIGELLPNSNISKKNESSEYCSENYWYSTLCNNFLVKLCGVNPYQLNTTMIPVYMSHTPAGSSSKQLIHFAQEYISAKFRMFDYGWLGNLVKYRLTTPPEYDLSKTKVPIALYYGRNDHFVDPMDVVKLYSEISNGVRLFRVNESTFNHLDFVFAMSAPKLLYEPVVEMMNKYDEY